MKFVDLFDWETAHCVGELVYLSMSVYGQAHTHFTIERQDDKQIKQIIIDFKPANNVGE